VALPGAGVLSVYHALFATPPAMLALTAPGACAAWSALFRAEDASSAAVNATRHLGEQALLAVVARALAGGLAAAFARVCARVGLVAAVALTLDGQTSARVDGTLTSADSDSGAAVGSSSLAARALPRASTEENVLHENSIRWQGTSRLACASEPLAARLEPAASGGARRLPLPRGAGQRRR
jgi:hypothetical protein